ncbi:unnamed protein product [Linum trigynum]|uniref:Uncharacterized protein n=1 Tax=Linum trigynum TaxID=586398 RepID=A0AAV2CHD7_9ROSI
MEESWSPASLLPVSLTRLTEALRVWNKQVFGNIFRRKKALISKLRKLEMDNELHNTDRSVSLEDSTRKELEQTLWEEQLLWVQKSRTSWVNEGDRNTGFFHLSTLKRRRFNRIVALRTEDGTWFQDESLLQGMD